jgi:hypothetical protein
MAATRFLMSAALVGAAAAAAALAARGAPRPAPLQSAGPEPAPIAARPIAIAAGSIESIRVGMRDADWFELRRTDAGWRVEVDGGSIAADPVPIRRLLGQLESLDVDGPVARDPSSHPALGVAAKQAVHLIARAGDVQVADLRIGSGGFVRAADAAEVWKLEPVAFADLFAGHDGWEERTIQELPPGSIQRVTIEREGELLELVRRDQTWSVTAGHIGADLDPSLADALAARLERLEALDVTTAAAGSVGLDRPLVHLQIADATGAVHALHLAPALQGLHHAQLDRGPVWVAASDLVDLLDRAPADWRDLRLLRAEPEAIDQVRLIDRPGAAMSRGDQGWICPNREPLDPLRAGDLIDAVRTLRGRRLARPSRGAGPGAADTHRLELAASGVTTAIRIARSHSGWIAQTNREPPVTIDESAAAALLSAATALEATCQPTRD